MSSSEIEFEKIGSYTSAFVSHVKVTKVSGGPKNFLALVYQCKFNVDWDGAPKCYGWNNPAEKNSLGGRNMQKNLKPIDSLRNATYPIKDADKHPIGLFHGSNNFNWVGLASATREEADKHKLVIDDRDELESLGPGTEKYPLHEGKFPVVQKTARRRDIMSLPPVRMPGKAPPMNSPHTGTRRISTTAFGRRSSRARASDWGTMAW